MPEQPHANRIGRNIYGSRHFTALPGRDAARGLLGEIVGGACHAMPQPPRFPLTLYGGGDLGRLARDYFQALGQGIDLVVDRNAAALRSDPFWQGVRIAPPDEVSAEAKQAAQLVLCVATAPYKPLEADLAADGWRDIIPFYDIAESQRHRHPLSNGWFAAPLDEMEQARVATVLDGWDDDMSRAHHLQFLAWRLLREEWTFDGAPVTRDDRFFIPEVMAHAAGFRVFVDAGAHHGNVTRTFAGLCPDFTSIVAIEPDAENVAVFQHKVPSDVADRITLLPVALGADTAEQSFHRGLGYASQFSGTGQDRMQAVPLDSLNLAPDFVKLHLEGAEHDALWGARQTIRDHRPVLAVTTYHNADGLWRTPAMMMALDDYRCIMRLHSWCGTGAVVYAFPREKE
ncbi:MAG TPA: FkbM family methyltransferase [Sphingobium sp.]